MPLFSFLENEILVHNTVQKSLGNIIATERNQTERNRFHSFEILRKVNPLGQNASLVARG